MANLIEVEQLTRTYRVPKREVGPFSALRSFFARKYEIVRAVDALSFEIASAQRVGFLGPNGAGKTTTLKMLAGLLHPSSGRLTVDGFSPSERRPEFLRRIMLVMGQKQQLLWDLPPVDTFELNRAIYEVDRAAFDKTLDELVTLLEIGDVMRKPTRNLSLGERMKCELAAALVHSPRILFLDEPTIGLDVVAQAKMRGFVKDYAARHGATLLLTSHDMDDVAELCERILVIDKGVLSYDGSLPDLVHKTRPEKRVVLRFATAVDEADVRRLGSVVAFSGVTATLSVAPEETPRLVARLLAALPVEDLAVEGAPLEEVLAELFSRTRASRAESIAPPAGAPDGKGEAAE